MKKILLILVALVALVFIAAALLPKDFKIEKEVVINKSNKEVFNYLKMAKNENEWSPWMKKDPQMKQEHKGKDGTVGFINSWSGNSEVGVGEAEITAIVPNERIDYELRFKEPMQTVNYAYYKIEAVDAKSSKVTWGMTGRTAFPYNLICFFMHGHVEKEFSNGLNNLKEILEKK